jgi:hypothetical protein
MSVVLKVVRNEMGALFCTMPWYSSNDISLRVTEIRCACSLIFGTSSLAGSVSCILRKIMLRLISCIRTRIHYCTNLSVILSKMAGCGLLKIISFGVNSIRAVYSWENCATDCVRACPNSTHSFSA